MYHDTKHDPYTTQKKRASLTFQITSEKSQIHYTESLLSFY